MEPRRPADDAGNPVPDLLEQARLSAAAALCRGARVVWLTPPPSAAPAQLLNASVADAGGCIVDGHARDLEDLASAILKGLGAPSLPGAAGVLRAFAAHLRSRGRRLVVGIRQPVALPEQALRELGALLRRPGAGLALVLEGSGGDADVIGTMGVEPTRVRAAASPATPTPSAVPRRSRRRALALTAGAGIAAAAALSAVSLALRAPDRERLSAPEARTAPRAAATLPELAPDATAAWSRAVAEASSRDRVEAPPAAPPPADASPSAMTREDREALDTGRRALAALANSRSDAEWEEGTRILRELGPQPALVETLDELGARPGCVRKRGCVSTRDRLQAALCEAWSDAVERGEALPGLRCS